MKPLIASLALLRRPAAVLTRPMSLRAYLVLVIVVATIPLALFALHLVERQAAQARNETVQSVERAGAAFALLVEREVVSSIDLLTGLAHNDALQRGDAAAFHRQLQRGMPARPGWRGVYLAEPGGHIVLSSDQPYGTEQGRLRDGRALEHVRTTLQPAVTDLVRVAATGELVTGVQVPVRVNGRLAYVLGARIGVAHWQQLAERASVPEGGFLALSDREFRVVAHRTEPGRIGHVHETLGMGAARQASGLLQAPSLERRQAVRDTGWSVAAGLPAGPMLGTQAGALISLAIAGAVSLVLGLALAILVARQVSVPLRRLASGETGDEPIVVREIAILARALRDASEQREKALGALESAHRAAEAANRGKDEFLAMLGHELRNPLGAIAAAVEVLNRTQGQGSVAASARQVIERQTRHMAQLMNDLQDVSRASAGKLMLDTRRIELAALVWRAVEALRLAGRFRQHVLSLDLRPTWVEADPIRIEQVIANLLTNAAKYTPSEGVIEVTLCRTGNDARLIVRDNGMGIAHHMLPQVFDLFVQGERAADRRQSGMGLGLALVRRLVELQGGTVEAASDGPNLGSTFTVLLPAQAGDGREDTPWSGRHAVIAAAADATPLDTAMALGGAGCRVTLAVESNAAAQLIAQSRPGIVLVDVALPGCAALPQRARDSSAGTLVVGIAADAGALAGHMFDAVLQRPVDLQQLQRVAASRPPRPTEAQVPGEAAGAAAPD
jgi:signal transduction histidine kinase/CheY-like chemotaxis protein